MRKNSSAFAAAVLSLALCAASAEALSPPWHQLQRKLAYSYGANPCVAVGEAEQVKRREYTVRIDACSDAAASALATVLRRSWPMGGVRVTVRVFTPGGAEAAPLPFPAGSDPLEIAKGAFETALDGNEYFTAVREYVDPMTRTTRLFVEFKKAVIQFWNDDLSDLYGNFNDVAENVFSGVSRSTFKRREIGWSTSVE